MDRTRNKDGVGAPKSDSGQSATDPFKEKLEREGRRRFDRRDPRILGPGEADQDAPPIRSEKTSEDGEGASNAARGPADPFVPASQAGALMPDAIIPPGGVFVDPSLTTELIQQGEGAFVLPSEARDAQVALHAPAAGAATLFSSAASIVAGASAAPPNTGHAGPKVKLKHGRGMSDKADVAKSSATSLGLARRGDPAKLVSAKALTRESSVQALGGRAGGRPVTTDNRQDDIATGAIAALFLLLAGWIGFQGATQQSPADGRTEDALSRVSVASAPATDPFAGAPIDLRPTSPLPQVDPRNTEGAADGADNENLFAGAASAGGAPPHLAVPFMSPHVLAPFSLPPLMTASTTAVSEAVSPLPLSCGPNMVARAYFCTARTELTPASRIILERNLANLRACAAGNELVVTGYADTRGLVAKNAELSAARAESVAEFLRAQGLAAVAVTGAGELSNIEDGRNCANQRRVDITLKNGSPPPSRACTPPEAMAAVVCS